MNNLKKRILQGVVTLIILALGMLAFMELLLDNLCTVLSALLP
jgi:hypothetical protein